MAKVIKFLGLSVAFAVIAGFGIWFSFALYYQAFAPLRSTLIAIWAILMVLCLWGLVHDRGRKRAIYSFVLFVFAAMLWWVFAVEPKRDRNWQAEVAHTVSGQVDGNIVTLNNVRNFDWTTPNDFKEQWETRSYDLDTLKSVDLFQSHWGNEAIAHSLISFAFEDGQRVVFSIEIRKEVGESFSSVAGFFKHYELAFIAADENDIVRLRTNIRNPIEDVYLYPLETTAENRRALFLGYVNYANKLTERAEFYHTVWANCTTVILKLIRQYRDDVTLDARILISGYLPDLLAERAAFRWSEPYGDIRARAAITAKGQSIDGYESYSQAIRN